MPYAYTPGNPLQLVDPLGLYAGSAQLGVDCTPDVALWDALKDGFIAEIKSPAFWGSLAAGAACLAVSGGTAVVACGALAGAVHSAMAFEALPEDEQTLSRFLWSYGGEIAFGMLGGAGVGPARTNAVRAAENVLGTTGRAAERDFFAATRTSVARLEQGAANTAPRLSLDRIRVTSGGVDAVEAHLGRFPDAGGGLGSAEAGMVTRLRSIASGGRTAAAQDLRFYSHELRESVLYRQGGYPTGQPAGDAAYDLWDVLHTQALNDYGFPRNIAPDFLYHPSVLGVG
jgi:hypothetical protein